VKKKKKKVLIWIFIDINNNEHMPFVPWYYQLYNNMNFKVMLVLWIEYEGDDRVHW
jgi:hypothetical protein